MIDIHSHILPGIDDGSKSIEITLDMIKRAEREGLKNIVATPHFRRGCFEATYNEVKELVSKINKLLELEGIDVKVHLGQEVYYSERIIDDFEEGIIGTINDGKYMLLEFPMRKIPKEAADHMYELKLRGVTPIIAHPERYSEVISNVEVLNQFIDEGCLFQLNAGSIRGDFGKDVKKTAEKLIKSGVYAFIGSDAHNNRGRNTGILEESQEVFKKNILLRSVFLENEVKLLNNEDIYYEGSKLKKKKFFFI